MRLVTLSRMRENRGLPKNNNKLINNNRNNYHSNNNNNNNDNNKNINISAGPRHVPDPGLLRHRHILHDHCLL